jgi:hypothetical protein
MIMGLFSYLRQPRRSLSLLPARLLETVLESVLENSMRRAVARSKDRFATEAVLAPVRSRNKINLERRSVVWGNTTLSCLAFVTAVLCNTSILAQDYRVTVEQRASCTPDAFRLWAAYIPDATRVESCLKQQKSELSEACRLVFEQNSDAVASRSRQESWRTN